MKTRVYECHILKGRTEKGFNDKNYRLVQCWCGVVLKLAGLGSHLHYKHDQKRDEVKVS